MTKIPIRRQREQYPGTYVLVLTTFDADEWVFDAIRAGAAGYLLKDSSGEEIIAAIEGTVEGETHIDPAVADTLMTLVRQHVEPDCSIAAELTERELVVLQHLARGLTNADIAEKLFLAKGTVRNHVSLQGEQGLSSLSDRRRLIVGHRIIGRTRLPTVVCLLASTLHGPLSLILLAPVL